MGHHQAKNKIWGHEMYMEVPYGILFGLHWSISIFTPLYQMRNRLVCRKLHQVVLSWWVAAKCFHALYVEMLDVQYSGRMVPWLCFVASMAVFFARDVGIGMLTITPFSLHWSLYLFFIYISISNEKWTCL
jgi:hypothetical protein